MGIKACKPLTDNNNLKKMGLSNFFIHLIHEQDFPVFFLNRKLRFYILGALMACASFLCPAESNAETKSKWKNDFSLPRQYAPSTNASGMLGLNTIPSARMDKKGTMRVGASKEDPYYHSFIGFQLTDPFYVSFRQTAETDSLTNSPDAFYPGVDFKLRLMQETENRPAMVVGLDSAFGHKRMASEYLSFSKRYKNFDFTGGMAWGRLGSKGHIKNPLRAVSDHFGKTRDYDSFFDSQDMDSWFTGEDIGFFGGVEYYTPINGLSLKADYGANDYIGEQNSIFTEFDAPAPWGLSLNYKPIDQIDISAGVIGGEQFMARFSLQDQIQDWIGRPSKLGNAPELLPRKQNAIGSNEHYFNLSEHQPTGRQIGRTTKVIANEAQADKESIRLSLRHKGLKGPVLTLMRKDIEQATLHNHGSPEEIWHNTTIKKNDKPLFDWMAFNEENRIDNQKYALKFILDQEVSLSESDAGILYDTAALIEGEKTMPWGFLVGATGRVNIANNLKNLSDFRFRDANPVRSDEDLFASNRFGVDRFYGSWLKSLTPNTHVALTGGYLEEMFSGYGGEILYRPFGKTFAIGAEGWRVNKRDPDSFLASEIKEQSIYTGHVNLFYEMPNQTTTAYLKIGQYLREDKGATFGVKNNFENGTKLEAFITGTDQEDADILGNSTHMFGGVRVSLPLGNIPYVPDGSELRLSTQPFARDSGQILDNPQPLYDVTEPIASRQLHRSWKTLLD